MMLLNAVLGAEVRVGEFPVFAGFTLSTPADANDDFGAFHANEAVQPMLHHCEPPHAEEPHQSCQSQQPG
eukprot:1658166-Amphidinium_carterae.2